MVTEKDCFNIKKLIIDSATLGGEGHLSTALSEVEIIATLCQRHGVELNRDFESTLFILSKGHGALGLYATFLYFNLLRGDLPNEYNRVESKFKNHPNPHLIPQVIYGSGSLGNGIGFAAGIAKARKICKRVQDVYCLVGDGECNEGSVWEIAQFAVANNLDNLTVIVDNNNLQCVDRHSVLTGNLNLKVAFESFGWHATEINGNSLHEINTTLSLFKKIKNKPKVIIAKTISGFGTKTMLDDVVWHYKTPTIEERDQAVKELENHYL